MENGNQPAFGYGFANEQHHLEEKGLTKREYFAAMALQGFLTNKNRFVGREEGAIIAFDANQIDEEKQTLFSEDLY